MNSISIHPRNSVYGNGEKKNTSGVHKGKGKLAWNQKHLTNRRNAHSATLKSLPSKLVNPLGAFKTPGSMKGRS